MLFILTFLISNFFTKGILGLGYSGTTEETTLFENMYNQGLVKQKIFSFWPMVSNIHKTNIDLKQIVLENILVKVVLEF